MPLLGHFCFCCSVRLGTIFSGIFAAVSSGICLYFLGVLRAEDVEVYIEEYDVVGQVEENFLIFRIVTLIRNHLSLFLESCIVLISLHLITCILLIVGALRLIRYLMIPFMIFNMGKIFLFLGIHIIAMMSLKKQLPLGELIATTCAGGFYILFLLYMWSSSVALYQQIRLVNSEKYRKLYGDSDHRGNFLHVEPARTMEKKGTNLPRNDSNMLYKDFIAIYSRKRY